MRRSFLLYLFVFTALIAVFLYVTSRRMLQSKERESKELNEKIEDLKKKNDSLRILTFDQEFTFEHNDQAMSYFEAQGREAGEVIRLLEDEVFGRNIASEDNNLVPYDGMEGDMRINKFRILNHKWIIADFTDGTYWGEVMISYYFDENKKLQLQTQQALLYPVN